MDNFEVRFIEQGIAEVLPCEAPAIESHQLMIETQVSLISPGTERAFFLGLPNTTQVYPQSSGYSNIGVVIAVGEGIQGWSVGDRVATRANHRLTNVVNADECLPLPDGLHEDHAAFFQLAAIAMQGVQRGSPQYQLGSRSAAAGVRGSSRYRCYCTG